MVRSSLLLFLLLLGCTQADAGASVAEDTVRGGAQITTVADSIRELIPVGSVRATSMDLVAPPRAQEFLERFQATARRDPQWWMDYVKANAQPGEPLPYHPNFGLSQAEYQEMLALATQLRLAPVGEGTLTVQPDGESRFVFDGGAAFPDLTGIVVDLEKNQVETPIGVLTPDGPIEPSPEQNVTGPWHGMSWRYEDGNLESLTGTVAKFRLGRLQESGRGILQYEARQMRDGELQVRIVRVLTYELPPQ